MVLTIVTTKIRYATGRYLGIFFKSLWIMAGDWMENRQFIGNNINHRIWRFTFQFKILYLVFCYVSSYYTIKVKHNPIYYTSSLTLNVTEMSIFMMNR